MKLYKCIKCLIIKEKKDELRSIYSPQSRNSNNGYVDICNVCLNKLQLFIDDIFYIFLQPERSKREDSQNKIMYCSLICAQEGNKIFINGAICDYGYCKDTICANFCYANNFCGMRCSEHCGNTVSPK